MSKEIEKRFFNFDYDEIQEKLKELKAEKVGTFLFRVLVFNPPNANMNYVRIRDEGFRKTFTIKIKTKDYPIEHETEISDFDATRNMLELLGLKKKYYYEKIRMIYNIGDIELVFDSGPGLPAYIEIEGPLS
jgi:adenylate cyclase class 2